VHSFNAAVQCLLAVSLLACWLACCIRSVQQLPVCQMLNRQLQLLIDLQARSTSPNVHITHGSRCIPGSCFPLLQADNWAVLQGVRRRACRAVL
jgi:hypothetical protein